jgi:serine/threonine protein kinase
MITGSCTTLETSASPRLSFGKYQLVRHLATGGMAEVILARVQGIEGFERHVVIKKIRDESARDDRFVQMFLDEARLAASLHHNNIVQVYDIGQENGEYFFTMEYVHGEDLRRLLAHIAEHERRVPLAHCVTIALATAAALHHAHEHRTPDRNFAGIVHRDVSPANILVAYDGNVKVVDFGIAKLAQRTEETGLMKGKVAYMSPEQCLGLDVDRRSDIFCLGIVLYELVTVRRLFKGANDFLTQTSITHGKIPRPSEIRGDIPPELEAIILKALAAKPEDRYQTADQMRAALERFAATAKLQTSTTALADFMRAEFGQRDVPWMIAEDEPEMSIDFDGAMTGVVAAPEEAVAAQSGGVVAAASSRASSSRTASPGASPPPIASSLMPLTVPSASLPSPTSGAASSSSSLRLAPSPRKRRRLVLAVAGAGAAAAIAAAIVLADPWGMFAPASNVSQPLLAPKPAPAPPPAPVTPPNLMPSASEDPPAPPLPPAPPEPSAAPTQDASPAASDAAIVEKKPSRPIKRKTKKPVPQGVWDPKALLPPK